MAFEKYEDTGRGRGRPAGADPMISLRQSGSIGVNGAAVAAFFADADGAVLYFNESDAQIGIEPVDDADAQDAAYTVTKTENAGTIAPRAFLEDYDLVPEVTTQYDPRWEDDRGLVVIDLGEPIGTYGEASDTA